MGMGRKERKELVSVTISQLEEVMPASGKPEELVKLTTAIVQSTKKLLEGTPEDLLTKSTATLSDFVVAARKIAKDPRSVDAATRQALSSSRRAVDALVRELNSWHDERQGRDRVSDDVEVALNRIASQTSLPPPTGNGGPVTGGQDDSSKEKELKDDLKKEQIALWKKTEPQQAPMQHGKPSEALTEATGNLQKGARGLVEAAGQKAPSPAVLLEPALQLTRAVSVLLDLVDSLFVSRYPMRAQVHGFCCTLVENSLSFGSQSRTEDASSLRTITTEVPALRSAAEVMITQSHKRAQDLEGQKKLSIQRSSDLQLLCPAQGGVMGVKKRGPPPKPPAVAEKPKEEAEFEIICVLCTNVAVNQEDKKPMSKGTEVPLLAYSSTSILDVKRMLQSRTGLPRDHIEVKMQGDDVLPDSTRVKPNNPVPYFIFNTHEPSDRELQEIRKIEKIKNRPKLEDIDWSQFSGPVAIALYDYDALGEEGTLNFDEGDIVEIVEKSPDGWWRGRMQDTEGDFPASFVEEVEIPTTMEEKKQLALRFRKNSPDQLQEADAFTFQDEGRASPGLRKLRKLQSNPEPTSKAKVDRRTSEPVFSQLEGARKDKKRHGLFKKRGGTQYGALQEEPVDISNKKSPFMSDRRKKKVVSLTSSWEDATASIESPEIQKKQPLVKPMASPKATKRKIGGAVAEGAPKTVRPRRPPPPVPTARATHVAVDTDEMIRLANDDVPLEQEGGAEAENDSKGRSSNPCSPPTPAEENSVSPELVVSEEDRNTPLTDTLSPDSVKKSESMEELLKNLEEFDEVISSQNGPTSLEIEEQERDFATIPRSELPVAKKSLGVPSVVDEDQKSKSTSNTPEAVRKSKPSVPSRQKLVQNGFSHSQPDEPTQPKPMAPPRRKKKMSQQLLDRVGVFEDGSSSKPTPGLKPVRPAPRVPASCPPPKPERDETKRKKTRLEVMAERQASSSAPTSRNASPDVERLLTKESSTSQEGLDSRSPGLAKRSPPSSSSPPPSLSYAAAHKCIGFLSDEERVATEHVFRSRPGSSEAVDMWLRGLDRGEAPDLSDIRDTADVTALLKALLSSKRLGPLIDYPLAKAMCDLVKGASPVSVLGNQLEQLTAENRGLLKELLRLFGLVINYSDKNKIEVSDLNRMFGSVLFDRLPPAKTEQLLAYLISTCELLIAS